MPLMGTCPVCRRPAYPAFRWEVGRIVLACTTCHAVLVDGGDHRRRPDASPSSTPAGDPSAIRYAVCGAGRWQAVLLQALRGRSSADPCALGLAPEALIPFIEGLVGLLAPPLGIANEASLSITGSGEGGGLRCSPDGLSARAAFAAMAGAAALLALSAEELDSNAPCALWRRHARGQPIELKRLWTRSSEGGAVLRGAREAVQMAAMSVGATMALTILGDSRIAQRGYALSHVALPPPAPPRPPPTGDGRFNRLTQEAAQRCARRCVPGRAAL